ncbi:PhoH family protein [Neisseria perflava]|uniref:PhoH family protein n=1 Tax=Neisseria perflava TaxID=33053 RepID=UPI0020A1F358|nr:PhoH family protein [Neisseria perflava]MCP1660168.1 PhoH-like ATPase [Neisseria perflava]MCP1772581.1 PhoH-like ATPase [Neisseria perflava]
MSPKLSGGGRKLFVLDTNVLLHDPSCLFRFQEHDIFIPMVTLEEMDNHKKGLSDVARNARQASRYLDELLNAEPDGLGKGISLRLPEHTEPRGKLFLQIERAAAELPEGLAAGSGDNQILAVVTALAHRIGGGYDYVALVSKDINIRIKARALGLHAEDYINDKVLEDSDILYSGSRRLPPGFWTQEGIRLHSWQERGRVCYRIEGGTEQNFYHNELLSDDNGESCLNARVVAVEERSVVLETLKDYSGRNNVFGIAARNGEQNFALNLLMNPDIDLVTILGQAGTGKTLLTLAAALMQTFDEKRYNEIIMTRVTVPVGEDIGFLPGTEEEKMNPWMGALEDNLEVLTQQNEGGEFSAWAKKATSDLIRSRIKIRSLNFMRGRTFQNKFVIIDEAQNLTPKQMKTLITRAGKGTKVVCLGNLAQIDTPYLTEGSSGLSYVVDRFKGWPHYGHITLVQGERSRLSDYAVAVL